MITINIYTDGRTDDGQVVFSKVDNSNLPSPLSDLGGGEKKASDGLPDPTSLQLSHSGAATLPSPDPSKSGGSINILLPSPGSLQAASSARVPPPSPATGIHSPMTSVPSPVGLSASPHSGASKYGDIPSPTDSGRESQSGATSKLPTPLDKSVKDGSDLPIPSPDKSSGGKARKK